MKNKGAQNRAKSIPKKRANAISWYKDPTSIIGIASIITSLFIGVASIINSRSLIRLERDFYTPSLQYHIGQEIPGEIIIDVVNNGNTAARNLTINISWQQKLDLRNCAPQRPFQDALPVTPIVENNLTYRLTLLASREAFQLNCEISATGASESTTSETLQILLESNTIPVPGTDVATQTSLTTPTPTAGFSFTERDFFTNFLVSDELIKVEATAENSFPATGTADQSILTYQKSTTSLPGLLEYLSSQSTDEFVSFCNTLVGQSIFWKPLIVKETIQDYSFVPLVSPNIVTIKIRKADFKTVNLIGLDEGNSINLYGTIRLCENNNGIKIWIQNAHFSLRTDKP